MSCQILAMIGIKNRGILYPHSQATFPSFVVAWLVQLDATTEARAGIFHSLLIHHPRDGGAFVTKSRRVEVIDAVGRQHEDHVTISKTRKAIALS